MLFHLFLSPIFITNQHFYGSMICGPFDLILIKNQFLFQQLTRKSQVPCANNQKQREPSIQTDS